MRVIASPSCLFARQARCSSSISTRAAASRSSVPGQSHRRCIAASAAPSGKMADKLITSKTFFLDNFALRQWDDPNYGGTRVSFDKAEFVKRIQDEFDKGSPLVDGYAPFCKHIFVPNFVGARLGALTITDANRGLLRSGYTKRRPEEMAVLTRWFCSADVEVPEAKYLDIILYSREQLVKEYDAMPTKAGAGEELPTSPWGIISVKAQDEPFETPMQPITMLRNALGREEGGSGVPLDKQKYADSVAYWEEHATIVDGAKPNGE